VIRRRRRRFAIPDQAVRAKHRPELSDVPREPFAFVADDEQNGLRLGTDSIRFGRLTKEAYDRETVHRLFDQT
jgi:hypothetical protein